jgi:alpha-beta hydrolase superfamily lysophospholipase
VCTLVTSDVADGRRRRAARVLNASAIALAWSADARLVAMQTIPLSDPELFTANPERQRYIATDPLSLRRASARFLLATRSLDSLLRHQAPALRLPVLLFLAGLDRIVDNGVLRGFFAALPDEGKRLVHYPEAHHTLEFEPDPGPFFKELVRWVLEMH